MIVKVEEAKKRWCQAARVPTSFGTVVNRASTSDTYAMTRCLADGCMAWEWGANGLSKTEGYCGLTAAAHVPVR